jgi:hypothetical protein
VAVPLDVMTALMNAGSNDFTDSLAQTEYFDGGSTARIVVFGHTHAAKITTSENSAGEKVDLRQQRLMERFRARLSSEYILDYHAGNRCFGRRCQPLSVFGGWDFRALTAGRSGSLICCFRNVSPEMIFMAFRGGRTRSERAPRDGIAV